MSVRNAPLFDSTGRPTLLMMGQWRQLTPAQPLRNLVYLAPDRTALPHFHTLWAIAFPTRGPLPQVPLADEQGRGTDEFWDALG